MARFYYDEYGSRTYFEYGNGVSSSYIYNAATRRLQNLSTTATNGNLHNITYTYDPVGNITNITNAATGADGLGGSFTYNYSYDELYRLAASSGGGKTDGDASYTLAMAYSPSGNILQKTLSATKQLLGNSTYDSYSNEYTYSGAHTLANVYDLQGGMPSLGFAFDGNGNMVMQQLYDPNSGLNERALCWDEENRLSATRDNNYVTANIYDASGNRAWKIAGEMNWMWQNGSGWQGYGDLNLRTWYQSELMTITDVGFTKHYFIAGQKIASKLGEGFRNSDELHPLKGAPLEPIYSDYTALARAQVNRLQRDFDCLGVSYGNFNPGEGNIRLLDDYEVIEIGEESDIYFYHSDHLGSSSFLTDGGGVATQHLQYMPFGEDLVHQQNTAAYYTPYTFSGKERDMETGFSYFGARYYDAGLSIWLSVDPMSDKYPSISAYNYCNWNPVMLVDPDGNSPLFFGGDDGSKRQKRAELAFAMAYPMQALRIGYEYSRDGKNITSYAGNFSINLARAGNMSTGEGSQRNALRHGVWQAIITRDFGTDIAATAGYAHEGFSIPNVSGTANGFRIDGTGGKFKAEADVVADLFNNQIGQLIGKENPNATNTELAGLVLQEFRDNGMYTVTPTKTGFEITKTKISQSQYEAAINALQSLRDNGLSETQP